MRESNTRGCVRCHGICTYVIIITCPQHGRSLCVQESSLPLLLHSTVEFNLPLNENTSSPFACRNTNADRFISRISVHCLQTHSDTIVTCRVTWASEEWYHFKRETNISQSCYMEHIYVHVKHLGLLSECKCFQSVLFSKVPELFILLLFYLWIGSQNILT